MKCFRGNNLRWKLKAMLGQERKVAIPGGGDESAEQRCEPASSENGY